MRTRVTFALTAWAAAVAVVFGSGPAWACSPLEDATLADAIAIQTGDVANIEPHVVEEYARPIVSIVERFTYAEAAGTERISRRSAAAVTRSWGGSPRTTADRVTGGVAIDDADSCGPETGASKGTYVYTVEFADDTSRRLIVPRSDTGAATIDAERALEQLAGGARVHADPNELLVAPPLPMHGSTNAWIGPLAALAAAIAVMAAAFGIAGRRSAGK